MPTQQSKPNREPDIRIPFKTNYGRDHYVWYLDKFNEIDKYWFCNNVRYNNNEVERMYEKGAWIPVLTLNDYLEEALKI